MPSYVLAPEGSIVVRPVDKTAVGVQAYELHGRGWDGKTANLDPAKVQHCVWEARDGVEGAQAWFAKISDIEATT